MSVPEQTEAPTPERYELAAEAIAMAIRADAKAREEHGSSAWNAALSPGEFHNRVMALVRYWDWQDEIRRQTAGHDDR